MPYQFITPGIDPGWEYWDGGDPEVREILKEEAEFENRLEAFLDGRLMREKTDLLGIRFGKGNPDRRVLRLGRAKKTRESSVVWIPCKGCRQFFLPDKNSVRYCSHSCYKPTGAPKVIDRVRRCVACGSEFSPDRECNRYCSRKCASAVGVSVTRIVRAGDGCPVCGGSIPSPRNRNGVFKRYCSRRCGTVYRKRRARGTD